ncbi:MAG: radical SAM protein [Thermofilaceae archaeon]|nr:radical SAM protein [Thermofilaceae archaeon]MCX8180882.1 radical SAM protein [Thermofilaceae archaeon]MDW8003447.1 radical SAM protein [Thermofilaceae archaeon]
MNIEYKRIKAVSILAKSNLYDLDYAYNPYAGCSHGCLYCYARCYTRFRDAVERWGSIVYVKENALELLAREAERVKRGVVGVSTITDPYQPIEEVEKLARRGLELLLRSGFRVSIQTKSPLVLRDLDLFTKWRHSVDVGLTITTVETGLAKLIEPNAPEPAARAKALEKLSDNGVETWLFLGPLMRGVNDDEDNIKTIIEVAQATGSKLYFDYFRMKHCLENPMKQVTKIYPHATDASSRWRANVRRLIEKLCENLGVEFQQSFPHKRESHLDLKQFLN